MLQVRLQRLSGVSRKAALERGGVGFGEMLKRTRLASCLLGETANGCRVVIALPEIDPAFTNKQFLLPFLRDGKPLDNKEGPYRIMIPDEKRMGAMGEAGDDVKNGRRSVKRVSLYHHLVLISSLLDYPETTEYGNFDNVHHEGKDRCPQKRSSHHEQWQGRHSDPSIRQRRGDQQIGNRRKH